MMVTCRSSILSTAVITEDLNTATCQPGQFMVYAELSGSDVSVPVRELRYRQDYLRTGPLRCGPGGKPPFDPRTLQCVSVLAVRPQQQ
jgi:hypothetical protein